MEIVVRQDEWLIRHLLLSKSLSLLLQLLDECLNRRVFEEIFVDVLLSCMAVVVNFSVVAGQDILLRGGVGPDRVSLRPVKLAT